LEIEPMKKLALAFAAFAALGLALPVVGSAQAQDADKVVIKKHTPVKKKVVIKKHEPASKKVIIKKKDEG
jgi:hypothetical protein